MFFFFQFCRVGHPGRACLIFAKLKNGFSQNLRGCQHSNSMYQYVNITVAAVLVGDAKP